MIKQQQKITQLTNQLQGYKQATERENLSREAYTKRLNLLVYRLEEGQTDPWENRATIKKTTKRIFQPRIETGTPGQVNVVDLHRLPQYPLLKNKERLNRPIIF